MGASSVTGISGPGSVAGNQKGSEHMSLGVHKLIGPRVVAAGAETLVGTTGTVEIPALAGAVTDYIIMLTGVSTTECYVSTGLAAVASTDTWNFIITGGSGEVVNWMIVKKGL
jgi:hypothetical protein